MRYATVTSESWGWSRGTCSEKVSVIPEEEELIPFIGGQVQQHPQTNKLKGVGISMDSSDWQLISC